MIHSTFRYINEVDLLTKVQGHQNVVQLKGMWRIGGDVVLAMPYSHPCEFKKLVAEIEPEEVKLYVANLLSALEHVHKLGIIHRDVKPSNFLYDRRAKKFSLIDFGLARLASPPGGSKEISQSAECDCLGQLTVCPECESMPDLVVPIVTYICKLKCKLQYLRYNRNITASVEDEGIDLEAVCLALGLRGAQKNGIRGEPFVKAPPVTKEGLDLLNSLLAIDPQDKSRQLALWHTALWRMSLTSFLNF